MWYDLGMTVVETRYPVSVSSLKSYTRCGHQWYLERFHKPKPPKSPAAWTARGIAVHETILDWEKSDRNIDVSKIFVEHYDKCIEEFKVQQPDYDKWTKTPRVKLVKTDIEGRKQDGLEQLREYIKYADAEPWEVLRDDDGELWVERQFQVDLKRLLPTPPEEQEEYVEILPLRGGIDLAVVWPDDSVTIRDVKTGVPENDLRQIKTYGWVAQNHLGLPEAVKGDYFNSKLNREKIPYGSSGMTRLDYTTAQITKMYFDLSDNIRRQVFLTNPSNDTCKFCHLKDLCPDSKKP